MLNNEGLSQQERVQRINEDNKRLQARSNGWLPLNTYDGARACTLHVSLQMHTSRFNATRCRLVLVLAPAPGTTDGWSTQDVAREITRLLEFVSLNMRGVRKILKKFAKNVDPTPPAPGFLALEIQHPHDPNWKLLQARIPYP